MKKYSISKGVTLNPGTVLGLTDKQAASRAHALREVKKGVFEVLSPVQFKIGEVIGYEGDLPRVIATALEDSDAKSEDAGKQEKAPAAAKAPKAPKAPAAAKADLKPAETKPEDAPAAS
jgi:pyruvate/2-oxoglutarate dehydrogenase complex dihydrolipoamide acyltransferase (E2) component